MPRTKKRLVDLKALGIDVPVYSPPKEADEPAPALTQERASSPQPFHPENYAFRVVQMPSQNLWKVQMIEYDGSFTKVRSVKDLTDYDQKSIAVHMMRHFAAMLIQREIIPPSFGENLANV